MRAISGRITLNGEGLQHKERVVGTLTRGLTTLAKKRIVKVVKGTGSFISEKSIQVKTEAENLEIRFEDAIIAAELIPVEIPAFPHEDEKVWDSTDALAMKEIPEKLFILGGGIIGLEMAIIDQALGSEITIVEMQDQLIPSADPDMVKPLLKRLKKTGMKIHDWLNGERGPTVSLFLIFLHRNTKFTAVETVAS